MRPEDVPADLVEKARGALIDHDSDRLECYDHKNRCCPVGEAHGFRSREEHQARAALAAVLPEIQAQALREAAERILPYSGIGLANGATRSDVSAWLTDRAARLTDTTESVEDIRERFADSTGIPVEAITPTPGSNPHDAATAQGKQMMAELEERGLGDSTTEETA